MITVVHGKNAFIAIELPDVVQVHYELPVHTQKMLFLQNFLNVIQIPV